MKIPDNDKVEIEDETVIAGASPEDSEKDTDKVDDTTEEEVSKKEEEQEARMKKLEEGNKRLHYILTTKIVDEKYHGIRYLSIESLYGFRLISQDMVDYAYKKLEEFALANNCNVIATGYTNKRVEEFLLSQSFEKHVTIYRKSIY